jgi:outer membrane murein-binding lipoprotein Lpp
MKLQNNLLIAASILGVILIQSCKKEKAPELDSQTKQFNTDANNYKSESDQADNDINSSLSAYPTFGRGTAILSSPMCGATVDTTFLTSQKMLIFNFDGVTPCFSPSRTRAGQIKVQLVTGNHWSDAGAVLKETYINFKITRLSDNQFIMFNGEKTLKNINGNDWLGFLLGTSTLKYQSRAFNVSVTFNNASATWNTAHLTEWKYTPLASSSYHEAYITFTAIGDTSLNGFNNVSAWGVNRFGQNFTTYYNSSILSNTYCGLWRPNQGELVHSVNSSNFTLSLGVDQGGNPTPYDCAYGYKVVWTNSNGNTGTVIISY